MSIMYGITWIVTRTRDKLLVIFSNTGFSVQLLGRTVGSFRFLWRKRAETYEQIARFSIGGLPVCILVGTFTGMVLSLQVGQELAAYGQEANVGIAVSASMCREMGPVMTAFIFAGLIGSAIAAELGSMTVFEEIDALEVMSIDPVTYLVLPRVVALTIVCPMITIFTNLIGIVGGAFVAKATLDVDWTIYFDRALHILDLKDIYQGLFKSLVFGLTISTVGCAQGLQTTGGAEGVGHSTMKAVVNSFILILVLDYVMGWFFYPGA